MVKKEYGIHMNLDDFIIVESEKRRKQSDEIDLFGEATFKMPIYQIANLAIHKLTEPWLEDAVEVGYLVIPKKLAVKVGNSKSTRLLWIRLVSEWATRVRIGYPLLIYDYLHGEYIAGLTVMMGYDVAWHELIDRDVSETRDVLTSEILAHGDMEFLKLVPLIGIEPICTLKRIEDKILRGDVNFAPHIRAPAFLPSNRIINIIYGLPEAGPVYGAIMFGDEIITDPKTNKAFPYRMRPELLFEHELIAGSTGKGKTAKCKNDIYNFLDTFGGSVIVIDTHNEYSMIHEEPIQDSDPIKPSEFELKLWRDLGVKPRKVDDLVVWIPTHRELGEDFAVPEGVETRLFTIRFDRISPAFLQYYLPALSPQGYYALPKLVYKFRNMYKGNKNTLEMFYRWLENTHFSKDIVSDATKDALLRRIAAILEEGVFDTPGVDDIRIEDLLVPGRVNIIRVDLIPSAVARRIIVMHLIALVAKEKLRDYRERYPPTMLLIDEAHNYFPRFVYDLNEREWVLRTVAWVERIAREGRKFRLRIEFSTQSPEDLNPSILKTVNTYTLFGLTPLQIKTLKNFMELPVDSTTLINLPARRAIVFSRSNSNVPLKIMVPWALLRHRITKKVES